MITLIKNQVRQIGAALWFRPAVYSAVALLLATTVALVDSLVSRESWPWMPEIELSTVRDLLNLSAGSMLTVITVTLSVLMLVLSLVAGQASPRAVPELMADPVTQNALGTFLATFVFSIASLLVFGLGVSLDVGVTLTFCITIIYIAMVIKYFIHWIGHVANSLKINKMIEKMHDSARVALKAYLSVEEGEGGEKAVAATGRAVTLTGEETGYIQYIDLEVLCSLAEDKGLVVSLLATQGSFIHPRLGLMEVYHLDADDAETREALVRAVAVGFERSHRDDPLLGFELIAEAACRALSPGINDPQTAITAVQFQGSLLCEAAALKPEDYPQCLAHGGRVRLERPGFQQMLKRALPPVIRDGSGFIEVLSEVQAVLLDLSRCCDAAYLESLEETGRRVQELAEKEIAVQADRDVLLDQSRRLSAAISARQAV